MTSPNNSNKNNTSANNETDKESSEKQNGMLAGILERATKSGLGRKKSNPSPVGSAVAKDMADIHSNPTKLRLAFLGGGSFGTAMANLAARNGCDTTLWVRNKRTVKAMAKTQTNKKYLPGYKLDDRLKYSHDLAASVKDKDIIFIAVPGLAFRETLKNIAPFISGQSIVSLTKGMEKDTFAMMSDIIKEVLPEVNFGVMSGPNLAIEIMKNMPSATVIASESEPLRHAVQAALHSAFFRVFASDDIRGVELGGALKNIYAIAMGMAAAYKVGENTKAMILTRALAEMSRFGVEEGANPLTFLGLSGVGDLYATCSSELSRNYRIGNMLGRGMSIDAAVKKLGQTAEGVNTIQQVHEKATKAGIYMPITHALYAVIYEDKAALGVALHLMEAGFRSDVEFVMAHDHSNAALTAHMKTSGSNTKSKDSDADK
ncbi:MULTISPECIES: NAD(P)H-dependent glycerol-3-phosphate dehydrogenase [Psychrobacter]|jgi:glycerol-3-phosphate dehydrogenase (NAD(P)+)|uniref:NAD(P)H-dependent glycerol-3-phosphate dehydrogenase n=1 Tax=Psychrobacter TaxID=497 RepID=UPI000C333672|nr:MULTISPECIES: NAD(P)H-dependent glycerol-3-phosphate dehydrogenase [Psychrobacter]MBA6245603.1 NAD(P)H-dependent glycerol-3-phosphate dehydrogenase [Psychrobacter sp. Urea-trap-18]MBA6286161.1 NAD(P)H-dependent glycerol-3-phosphate dehydrogenase [Psychrobacter sp. Urea-trap-16]MBA6318195.1 NAD(P)H-dependent glycerol-3-phosphate dehydrogenase [Psychrobacter sp. Urea-trap-20]MBA6334355.1 NAD(P)H-dependent glycerol-3-phosphate dehydrogenase [Psychrobacter sp. Urea-trap-19]PKG60420.1 NAD(P)H-de